jgi:hypothetical protein
MLTPFLESRQHAWTLERMHAAGRLHAVGQLLGFTQRAPCGAQGLEGVKARLADLISWKALPMNCRDAARVILLRLEAKRHAPPFGFITLLLPPPPPAPAATAAEGARS